MAASECESPSASRAGRRHRGKLTQWLLSEPEPYFLDANRGSPLMEGWLSKHGRLSGSLRLRFYKLFGDGLILYYCTEGTSASPRGSLIVGADTIIGPAEDVSSTAFRIIHESDAGTRHEFKAQTMAEKDAWIQALCKIIDRKCEELIELTQIIKAARTLHMEARKEGFGHQVSAMKLPLHNDDNPEVLHSGFLHHRNPPWPWRQHFFELRKSRELVCYDSDEKGARMLHSVSLHGLELVLSREKLSGFMLHGGKTTLHYESRNHGELRDWLFVLAMEIEAMFQEEAEARRRAKTPVSAMPGQGAPVERREDAYDACVPELLGDSPVIKTADDPDQIKVGIVTWNMNEKLPSVEDTKIVLREAASKSSIVAICTQECKSVALLSAALTAQPALWHSRCSEYLRHEGLVPLAHELMGAIHIAVFVSAQLFFSVSCVETAFVPCGFGGFMFNKGCVAVSMKLFRTSFCFTSNHFAAHQHKVTKRHNDYHRVNNELFYVHDALRHQLYSSAQVDESQLHIGHEMLEADSPATSPTGSAEASRPLPASAAAAGLAAVAESPQPRPQAESPVGRLASAPSKLESLARVPNLGTLNEASLGDLEEPVTQITPPTPPLPEAEAVESPAPAEPEATGAEPPSMVGRDASPAERTEGTAGQEDGAGVDEEAETASPAGSDQHEALPPVTEAATASAAIDALAAEEAAPADAPATEEAVVDALGTDEDEASPADAPATEEAPPDAPAAEEEPSPADAPASEDVAATDTPASEEAAGAAAATMRASEQPQSAEDAGAVVAGAEAAVGASSGADGAGGMERVEEGQETGGGGGGGDGADRCSHASEVDEEEEVSELPDLQTLPSFRRPHPVGMEGYRSSSARRIAEGEVSPTSSTRSSSLMRRTSSNFGVKRSLSKLDVLKLRLDQGEIGHDEYQAMAQALAHEELHGLVESGILSEEKYAEIIAQDDKFFTDAGLGKEQGTQGDGEPVDSDGEEEGGEEECDASAGPDETVAVPYDERDSGRLLREFDVVFFSGDFNYRIDSTKATVERLVSTAYQCENSMTVVPFASEKVLTDNFDLDAEQPEGEGPADDLAGAQEPPPPGFEAGGALETVEAEGTDSIMQYLRDRDQLLKARKAKHVFEGFEEGGINFRPTFKFDPHSTRYDTSAKARVPAWCDRIMFKPQGVTLNKYDAIFAVHHSDHRPVFATFTVDLH